jgi:hypothetical protein
MDEAEKGQSDFVNWETSRETSEYINSVRKILRDRISNYEIGAEVFTSIFNLKDIKKFLEEKKLAITYDQVIYAADEDYKRYQKTDDLGTGSVLN